MKKNIIEPFVRYPESIIDSKVTAINVLKNNSYYFYVMGVFALCGAALLFYQNNDIGDLRIAISSLFTGCIYIGFAYFTYLSKSRISCYLLAAFVGCSFLAYLYYNGLGGLFFFQFILCSAVLRMVKAVNFYNKRK